MNRGVACCLIALVVVTGVPVGAATPDEAIGLPQEFDPDSVSLSANLQNNGSATWTFTYRMRLSNDSEVAAFESLQSDIRNNSAAYAETFRERISATVTAAADATNRNMSVSNVEISTRVNTFNEETLGVVTYSFAWSQFAVDDGERVVAGDALEGFYLDNETSLRISWPESYGLVAVDPGAQRPNENTVEWPGPREFSTGEPQVVVSPGADDATDSEDADAPPGDGQNSPDGGVGGLLIPAAVGALAAVGVLAAAGWYYRERYGDDLPAGGSAGGDADGAAAVVADEGPASDESTADGPPAELLSNEERVKRFLDSEGGRAKQQALVDATDWTEAKTSQVVKQMRENDEVESFRIGRENVLKLPDDGE